MIAIASVPRHPERSSRTCHPESLDFARDKRSRRTLGTQARVVCGSGDVWASAMIVGADALEQAAIYAIRIANNSEIPLRASIGGSDIAIAPFSIVEKIVPLPGGADIEIAGPGLRFSIDAPAIAIPAVSATRRAVNAVAIALTLLVAIALVAIAAWLARPSAPVAAVVAPAPVAVARAPIARAPAVPQPPLLDDLSISPLPVRAGERLTVRYATTAESGNVWLLDERGRIWARGDVHRSGVTELAIPQAAAGRELRLAVGVRRGNVHAQLGAGVIVAPDDANLASEAVASQDAPKIEIVPLRPRSGGQIRVDVGVHHGDGVVSLTDAGGSIYSEVNVPAGQRTVTIDAPSVGAPSTYDVVVSLSRGIAQDEVVRQVTIVP